MIQSINVQIYGLSVGPLTRLLIVLIVVAKPNRLTINLKYYDAYLFCSTKEVILWGRFDNARLQGLSFANIW